MSYDYMLFDVDGAPESLEDVDDDAMRPLGTGRQVRARLDAVQPGIRWTDHGALELDDGWFEFEVGADEPEVEGLFVRTSHGSDTSATLRRLAEALGLVAFDMQDLSRL